MLIIPSVILAIENENDRDFMEQLYRQYYRLMYHTIFASVYKGIHIKTTKNGLPTY